jgi:4-hydroxybenzoate polyprenyltransferase
MRFLVFSHIYIALCVVAITMETVILSRIDFQKSIPYFFIVFFSTLVAYNLKAVNPLKNFKGSQDSEKISWSKENLSFILWLLLVSAILLVIGILFLNMDTVLLLLPLGLLSLGYSWPVKIGKRKRALRELPFVKTLMVAFVWTIVVAFIPYVESQNIVSADSERIIGDFMFLFALALLFDIKDIESDKANSIKTIPLLIGVNGTKMLSLSIIFLRILYLILSGMMFRELVPEILITLLCAVLILKYINKQTTEYFYMVYVDGLILLKSFLVIFFYLSLHR